MNASSRKKEPPLAMPEGGNRTSPVGGAHRRVLLGAGLIVVLFGAAYYAWGQWGDQITGGEDYVLQPENFQVTPPPPWVRADVRAEVVRDGGLTGLSILDRQLTVKVYQAFCLHSWVENVNRVSKVSKQQPARVLVELAYRRPVAMVEVVIKNQAGLLPIDAYGVLLPPQDFTQEQTRDYLRISVPYATPTSPVGAPWGQADIHEAARIASVWQEHWQKCGLYRIQLVPAGSENSTQIEPTFELQSRSGAAIVWGRAPDVRNPAEEAAALSKVASVLAYVQAHGSLDSAPPGVKLDLRQPAAPAARTAERRPTGN